MRQFTAFRNVGAGRVQTAVCDRRLLHGTAGERAVSRGGDQRSGTAWGYPFACCTAVETEWLHDLQGELNLIALAENTYGKSSVRVMKVKRDGALHSVKEWKVEVLLS